MALVLSVIDALIFAPSILSVSDRMPTNTGIAPQSTKALAVDTKVYEGIIYHLITWLKIDQVALRMRLVDINQLIASHVEFVERNSHIYFK